MVCFQLLPLLALCMIARGHVINGNNTVKYVGRDQTYWDPREWHWPQGSYGLPQTQAGCPGGSSFYDGWRYHDTEDSKSANGWSNPLHLKGSWGSNNMQWHFCMKTSSTGAEPSSWLSGKYCLFKKGACPTGFNIGNLFWDDEDKDNQNRHGGEVPDGSYDRNTRLYFCCRTDGSESTPITLPYHASRDFMLFPLHDGMCQSVMGASITMEWFKWDTEDGDNIDEYNWPHPKDADAGGKNHHIYFCHYEFPNTNECSFNNGGCSQTCHDTVGSYYCACGDGYVLDTDRHTCTALSCGHPGEIPDGHVEDSGDWLYSTYAEYSCLEPSLDLVGFQYRQCEAVGTDMYWGQDQPECRDSCLGAGDMICGADGISETQCLQMGCCYQTEKEQCFRKKEGIYGQYQELRPSVEGFYIQPWSSVRGCQHLCDKDYGDQCKAFFMYKTGEDTGISLADCHLLDQDLQYYQDAGLVNEDPKATFYNKFVL